MDSISRIKKILVGTFIVGILSLPIYSLVKWYHTKFTAESHIQLKLSENVIEEVYYMDDGSDGEINRIRTYAGIASRGIHTVPFEYKQKDERFKELLNIRNNPPLDKSKPSKLLPKQLLLEEMVGQPVSVSMYSGAYMGSSYVSVIIRTEGGNIRLCNLKTFKSPENQLKYWYADKLNDITALIESEIIDGDNEKVFLRGYNMSKKFYVTSITVNGHTFDSLNH